MYQLDFFTTDPLDEVRAEVSTLKASHDKVRKSLYAKHCELAGYYQELMQRLEAIEKNICKGAS